MPIDFTPQAEPMPSTGPEVARLPHVPKPPFYLVYHPARWFYENGEFLPSLKLMVLEPGVGGVDKDGDSSLAETDRMKAGETVLPWGTVPPPDHPLWGGRPASPAYIKRYPCKGGYYHCEFWVTPRSLAGGVISSQPDMAAWRAWLRWLVAEGHVPQISAEAKELLLHNATSKAQRLEAAAVKNPARNAEALEARAFADAMTGPQKPAKAKA